MRFGFFDDVRREYVISRPDTPLPWINYLGCEEYFGLISNTGGGYSFYRDARLRRLTRYRYNNVPLDAGGRYIYLRNEESGFYWSPTWQPTRKDLDDYSCRHGMGYTVISSVQAGIEAQIRYFVPLGESLEMTNIPCLAWVEIPGTPELHPGVIKRPHNGSWAYAQLFRACEFPRSSPRAGKVLLPAECSVTNDLAFRRSRRPGPPPVW